MRKPCLYLLAVSAILTAQAHAAVFWDNGAGNNRINDALNWTTDSLPTGGTVGTIDTDTGTMAINTVTLDDYAVVQNTGTVSLGANRIWLNGSWTFNSGAAVTSNSRIILQGDQVFTINGGTLTTTGELRPQNTSQIVFMGGGSVTASVLNSFTGSLDWQTGSTATMTITGNSAWAEAAYNSGQLLFDGQDNGDLGLTWTEATGGGTQIWDFTGDTLSLVPIPEPASVVLMGMGAAAFGLRRGRRLA